MANKWLAAILSFFIPGLGVALSSLYKRFVVTLVIDIILGILIYYSGMNGILTIIGLLYSIYAAYDALICTEAANSNQAIPKLFGVLENME